MAFWRPSLRLAVLAAALMTSLTVVGLAAQAARAADAASVLFAVDAREGTLVPVKSKKRTYTLTLRGVERKALSFEDRPGTRVAKIGVKTMLGELFVKGQVPPNAAINADVPGNDQALMGVQLNSPRYSPSKRSLRFRVIELVQGKSSKGGKRVDVVLPRRFGRTALFIDDVGPGAGQVTMFNGNPLDMTVQVNNGMQFSIDGTGPGLGWTPQAPVYGGPTFSATGAPQPNVLAPGVNYVSIMLSGAAEPMFFPITIPNNVQFASLQIYFFLNTSGTLHWSLLNNGQLVADGQTSGRPIQ